MKYKILKNYKSKDVEIRLVTRGIIKREYGIYVKLGFFSNTIGYGEDFDEASSKYNSLERIISKANRTDRYCYPLKVDEVQSRTYSNTIKLTRHEIRMGYGDIFYHIKIEKNLAKIDFFEDKESDSIRLFSTLEWILNSDPRNRCESYINNQKTTERGKQIEKKLKDLGFKNRDCERYELIYGTIRKLKIKGVNYIITDFEFYNEMYMETGCDTYFYDICEYWKNIQLTKQPDFINIHSDHIIYECIKRNIYKDIELKLIKIKLDKDDFNSILTKYQIEIFFKEKPIYLFFNDLEEASKCYNLINSYWKKINKQNKEEKEEENKMADILREDKFNIGSVSLWYHNDSMKSNLPLYDVRLFFSTKDNSLNCPVKLNIDNFVDAYDLYKNTLNTIKNIESELMVSIYNQYCKNENECSNFKKKKDK